MKDQWELSIKMTLATLLQQGDGRWEKLTEVNYSAWFPQTYADLAVYFKIKKNTAWEKVNA